MRVKLEDRRDRRWKMPGATWTIESASIGFRVCRWSDIRLDSEPLRLAWRLTREGAARSLERYIGREIIESPYLSVDVQRRCVCGPLTEGSVGDSAPQASSG